MSKPESNGEREQLDLDNDTVKLAFAQWSDAQERMIAISDEILKIDQQRKQLQRRLQEAAYDTRLKWRSLRRAQGYPVD